MSQTSNTTPRLTREMLEDELDRARIESVRMDADRLTLLLRDGRTLGMPLAWSPKLAEATESEVQNYELIGHGSGLHWPDLDEYVSVRSILLGRHSSKQ